MQVNVSINEGPSGEAEAWVEVLSNELHDWPTVRKHLREHIKDHREVGDYSVHTPRRYYPDLRDAKEKAESGFAFQDWWVLSHVHHMPYAKIKGNH